MFSDLYGNLLVAFALLIISAVVAPFLATKRTLAGWFNFLMVAAASVIMLGIGYETVFGGNSLPSKLIAFGPVKIYFLLDSFAGFFAGVIGFMAIMSAFYSIAYMEHYPDYRLRSYYANFPIFIAGMFGIVTVDDLSVGFTIAWQMMTIASFLLVRFEYKKAENVRNANKYLVLMEIAWALILAGTVFISNFGIGDSVHELAAKLGATTGAAPYIVYALIFLGFAFKAGVFPLGQLWLPDAHSIAPSPISALLSGVMIKTGIYGIIRTFFWMVPHTETFHFDGTLWGAIIASIGVVTLFMGTAQSMKQSDAKRLLAYSSIGQIGYITMAVGAALFMFSSNNEFLKLVSLVAIIGAVYHILNHAVFKGLLFLSSGSVLYATGTKDLNRLGGLITIMPVTAVIAGVASLSISGVPGFSGFASKWTIVSSSLLAGSDVLFLVIFGIVALFTSALTLSCYVKFFGMTFTSTGTEWTVQKDIKEVPAIMLAPKIVLTALCLVQGLIPFFYYQAIIGIMQSAKGSIMFEAFRSVDFDNFILSTAMGVSVGVPGIKGLTLAAAFPVIVLAVFAGAFAIAALLRRSGGSEEKLTTTWLCGYQELSNNNRYKDKNMFAALKNVLRWTGGNVKD